MIFRSQEVSDLPLIFSEMILPIYRQVRLSLCLKM